MKGFDEQLIELYPYLQRLAVARCKNITDAEDLVQETMLKAIAHAEQFCLGTNLRAWATVILNNTFLSNVRKIKQRRLHMFALGSQDYAVDAKEQFYRVAFNEAMEWMTSLPKAQREALEMVGLEGETYTDAARRTNVAVGTIKSRTSRARSAMREHRPE